MKEELPEWTKLPKKLQEEYFKKAKEEAEKIKKVLIDRRRKIQKIKEFFEFENIDYKSDWKNLRIGVVDGSNSKNMSERLGVRYGVYAACYQIYEGDKLIEENFFGDYISQNQIDDPELATKVLSFKRFLLEREVAISCLKDKDLDYLVIDGSFFGYRGDIRPYMEEEEVQINEEFFKMGEIIEKLTKKTLELLNTNKAIGIIKRSRLSVIDGWLTYKFKSEDYCLNMNDKYILSFLMPPKSLFTYNSLFKEPYSYYHFSKFRKLFRKYYGKEDIKSILNRAEEEIKEIVKILKCPLKEFLSTKRYYVRCSNFSYPFELEAPKSMFIKPILVYFLNFYNEATGLPFLLDLVDESITLPSGFLREFVEEIEAHLVKEALPKEDIFLAFSHINPQKLED